MIKWLHTPLFSPVHRTVFLRIFAAVFSLVVITAILLTFSLPASYIATARVKVESFKPADESDTIKSKAVLLSVIDELDLRKKWAHRHGRDEALTSRDALGFLAPNVAAITRATNLFEIQVRDLEAQMAADVANAVARNYRDYRNRGGNNVVEIIDLAQPPTRAIQPNKPKWITIGILIGLLFGSLVGAAAASAAKGIKTGAGGDLRLEGSLTK